MSVIKTEHLTKKYKQLVAVDDISLEIEEGECFGLLGPNGAGKTTLIKMITAVSPPTAGEMWIQGKSLKHFARQAKAVLGVVPQMDNLDPDLSVLQNLLTFARYFDIPRDEASRRSREVLKLFELEGKQNSQIRELSGGMKRRLLLARGLLNHPRILVLDEPTIGLDPQAKYLVWHKLAELKSQGVTEFLCTQNMEEATTLCDRVAIMHQGKILSLDKPQELIYRYVGREVIEVEVSPEERGRAIAELQSRQLDFEDAVSRIYVFHVDGDKLVQGIASSPDKLKRRPATLEDVFFRLTGRSLIE
ncbi:MAG: ABC transporter ATP-binding protein [Chloroflexi bacterium]|nr:ABC transporter ATP-binding protein [Chloroflexota bacterium]